MTITLTMASIRDAVLSTVKLFAEGGTSWAVRRPTGDGVAAARMFAPHGQPRTLYILRGSATKEEHAGAGGDVPRITWIAYGHLSVDILPGDEITSAAVPTMIFAVISIDKGQGYLEAMVTPK